ncbi:hypothetical protein GTQ34_14325 [Muricauda sp. JGD-17]|uniref:HNH domain-containing protein n=1 Tax=Flagellimonas ochracea TaxID=2696472 RepID=A0A964TF89_9FLAO|nr:HNH endonuclease signature motif containing protein [Allomuricauda ochracea]NAY93093.1 hypothetical protein [Allomuricauda ochracea]
MRPVTKITPPPHYQVPATQKFAALKGGVINPVNYVFQVHNNTPIQTTAILEKMQSYSQNPPAKKTVDAEAFRLMKVRMYGIYGSSRRDLIDNFGQYCNFCGLPVYDSSLAVEHTLPKDQFPIVCVDYNNFLLVCPVCNSKKGSRPTYADGVAWSGVPHPTLAQVRDAAFANFMWATLKEAYRGFYPTFLVKPVGQGNWTALPPNYAFYLQNSFIETSGQEVIASIFDGNQLQRVAVMAFVNPNNNVSDNMLKLIGQNDFNPNAPELSDRRILNLTKTWLAVLEALKGFEIAVGTGNQTIIDTFFNQLKSMASAKGFYYMWIFILQYFTANTNMKTLVTEFVQKTANNTYFPGTNTAEIP